MKMKKVTLNRNGQTHAHPREVSDLKAGRFQVCQHVMLRITGDCCYHGKGYAEYVVAGIRPCFSFGGGRETVTFERVDKKEARWVDALLHYSRFHATDRQAYLAMMSDFRQGRAIPDVGTWKDLWIAEKPGQLAPPFCPPGWTPHGASYSAIMAKFCKLPRVQLHRAMEARKNKEAC